jgi:APA family basic amino acid/polyamine antiporter
VVVLVIGAVIGGQPSPDPPVIAGTAGIFGVALATPFMFVGFDVIPHAAEESDIPHRSLGTLIVAAVLMATLFYIAVIWDRVERFRAQRWSKARFPPRRPWRPCSAV